MKKIKIELKNPPKTERGSWGKVKPFTRVEPDKTKYDRKNLPDPAGEADTENDA
ncbi:hypothetical protein FACS1894211_09760 [Clostridia bacterium]|nr:hypothetical protein FACS1894211_09760 [Clostridia bacterium]